MMIAAFLLSSLFAFAQDSEKELAFQVMKQSLECPIDIERVKSESAETIYSKITQNVYLGNNTNFILREEWKDAEMSSEGENYDRIGSISVSFAINDIQKTRVSGSKITAYCKGGSKCMQVIYKSSPEHGEIEEENYSRAKSSFRFSTCGNAAAGDIAEALTFIRGDS